MSDTLKFSQSTIMHHFNLQWLSSASVPRREQARLIRGESLAVRDSARSDDKTNVRLAGFLGFFVSISNPLRIPTEKRARTLQSHQIK